MKRGKKNPAGRFERCVKSVEAAGSATDPRAVCATSGVKKYGQAEMTRRAVAGKKRAARKRGNPAAAADAAFERTHGRPVDKVYEVKKRVHFHTELPGMGELRRMVVKSIYGPRVKLSGFRGARLAFNESYSQLFIEGGDQSIDLQVFGITRKPHELETLGSVISLDYYTTKDHLHPEDGGEATYHHVFATVNENGRPVRVKVLRYPDLIYRVIDEQLEFSGGDYEILAEGIDK